MNDEVYNFLDNKKHKHWCGLNSITTKWEASKILGKLIAKRNGRSQNNDNDSRDRKAAYGLAVKLVLKRYQQLNIDYKKSGSFWKDVDEFYQQYLQHQDRAIKSGSRGDWDDNVCRRAGQPSFSTALSTMWCCKIQELILPSLGSGHTNYCQNRRTYIP